ncbi:hypothetical protein RI367_000861 [Sorochytrium milnesiophthora]
MLSLLPRLSRSVRLPYARRRLLLLLSSSLSSLPSSTPSTPAAPATPAAARAPVVFAREAKRLQKNRAALHPNAQLADYLKDEVGRRLSERILDIKRRYPRIVDVGAGAGHVAKYLDTDITSKVTMCDSAEQLLYRDEQRDADVTDVAIERQVLDEEREFAAHFERDSLDMIVSSLALHWVNDLPGTLAQFRHALKPDGVFVGAMLGGDTLFELRTSLQLAEMERMGGMSPRVSPMTVVGDVANLMARAGFTLVTVDIDEVVVNYPTPFDLMDDLRAMGETNAVVQRLPFLRRDTLIAASAIYESLHGNPPSNDPAQPAGKSVPATFQILYMIGWKPAPSQPKPLERGSGKVNIPTRAGVARFAWTRAHSTYESHRQQLLQAERKLLRSVQCELSSRMVPIPVDFVKNKSPPFAMASASAPSSSTSPMWPIARCAKSTVAVPRQPIEGRDYYEINTVSTVTAANDQKPHLVLVHGWGGGLGIWMSMFDRLSERFQVHAIDLLGWGASSRPPFRKLHGRLPLSAQAFFVESLEAWRASMGIQSFTLAAHSMGGYVAAAYAIKYPDTMDKLVLISPIGLQGFRQPPDRAAPSVAQKLRSMVFQHAWTLTPQRLIHMMGPTRARAILGSARRRIADLFPYDDDTVLDYVYWLSRIAPGVSGEAGPQLRQLQDRVPTVLAYGINDWMDPSYTLHELRRISRHRSSRKSHDTAVPLAEDAEALHVPLVYILRNSGHHPYIENPRDLERVIMDGEKGTEACGVLEAGDDLAGVAAVLSRKRMMSIA